MISGSSAGSVYRALNCYELAKQRSVFQDKPMQNFTTKDRQRPIQGNCKGPRRPARHGHSATGSDCAAVRLLDERLCKLACESTSTQQALLLHDGAHALFPFLHGFSSWIPLGSPFMVNNRIPLCFNRSCDSNPSFSLKPRYKHTFC